MSFVRLPGLYDRDLILLSWLFQALIYTLATNEKNYLLYKETFATFSDA